MKLIINDNELGFLYKDGIFNKVLKPGKYAIYKFLGYTYKTLKITSDNVSISESELKIYLKDEYFRSLIYKIEVPDNHIALYYKENILVNYYNSGIYYLYNNFNTHDIKLIDISETYLIEDKKLLLQLPNKYYTKILVSESEVCILNLDGKFNKILKSGTYYYMNGLQKITYSIIDLRIQQLEVNSQEILTADKVTLRLNFICEYKIVDPFKITTQLKDYKNQIYTNLQLAIREYVGKLKFDELLEQKDSIADIILKNLKQKEEDLFITFTQAGLKDIILPGEIRDIMNTVLIAEKKAQSNVILRREEVASTRSLLNTAKLMDENKTLYKLKELEYIERICEKVGSISVGNGNLINELTDLLSTR